MEKKKRRKHKKEKLSNKEIIELIFEGIAAISALIAAIKS